MVHSPSPLSGRAFEVSRHLRAKHSPPVEGRMRPGARNSLTPNTASATAHAGRTRRTVLIVEDHPALQNAMSEYVSGMDFDVVIASHYAAARAHLASSTPDLVCIDIGLPTESGYELCEYIRGPLGLKRLPIVVTSPFGSPAEKAHAEEAGASAFLLKPFAMSQLGAYIRELLKRGQKTGAAVIQLDDLRAARRDSQLPPETGIAVGSRVANAVALLA
jgi:DNA-binding response OmpR family regulator